MFSTGKLPQRVLEELLASYPITDPRIIVGPKVGEDAAVIDFGDRYLIAKTDPITFATDRIGWYTVNINANDIAAMGGIPKWFLATVLLPEGKSDESLARTIFNDLALACQELGITLCGGHTEITYRLERPLVIGQMLGEASKEKLVLKRHAQVGDDLLLTKGIAIEATSIIAREKEEELKGKYDQAFLEEAKNFLYRPGISIVKEAIIANRVASLHAMHDPTEGGLSTGLYELAKSGGIGLRIFKEAIPILEVSKILCEEYHLDPLGIIASGALLILVSSQKSEQVCEALQKEGILCQVIGKATDAKSGVIIEEGGHTKELPYFEVDEISKIF